MKTLLSLIVKFFSSFAAKAPIPSPEPLPTPPQAVEPEPVKLTTTERIYIAAKLCLGKHITLNDNVPHDVGCAEAVSYVLKMAGVKVPSQGFAGTYELYLWLKQNASLATSFVPGSIIISPSGTSTINSPHGHIGINAKFGIMSNNSDSGLFTELWTLEKWNKYYHDSLGFPVYNFILP